MINKRNYYYVYYSYEEWGRGYIGYRGCDCLPEEDTKYFGSFKDKTFKPTQKIIFEVYKVQEEAIVAEMILHNFYKVDINPHFVNRARQTSKKFYLTGSGKNNPMYGKKHSLESIQKMKENQLKGDYSVMRRPEHRRRQSEFMKKNNPMEIQGTIEKIVNKTSKSFAFVDNLGSVHQGKNITKFCKKNGLDVSAMCKLNKGKILAYKGWSLYRS
jgi:hypothetical protein